jgi:hypothetical protein
VKKFVLVCVMFISVSSMLSAEALATWRVQSGSVILESSTNLANPSRGKSAVIAITYEKSLFKCKPSLAILSFEGRKLGSIVKQQSLKKEKNQLTFHINNKKFIAQNETKLNTYSNGIELVAFFKEAILDELSKPSLIKVSVGGQRPIIEFRTTNSITPSIRQISGTCN